MHDDENLFDLLMAGEQVAEGRYNHSTWKILSKGNLASEDALVASVHESMHHVLNNTTLFGLMLMVAAYLARERDSEKRQLKELVNNCRLTHESWATYSSLLLVSPEIASTEWLKDKYDKSYKSYVETAKAIVSGVEEPHLQFIVLNAVCRLCFQSKGLIRGIEDKSPFNVSPTDFPDMRFRYLLEQLDDQYWRYTIDQYRSTYSSDEKIQGFLQNGGDKWLEDKHGTATLDQVSVAFQSHVYTKVKQDFMHHTYESIDYDDHLDYTDLLIDYVEEIAPGELSIAPLKADPHPSQDFGLTEYQNESIYIKTTPLTAQVIRFSDCNDDDWEELQFSYDDFKHFYITSRVTEKLLNQFKFDKNDQHWLLNEYPDFVVAVFNKQVINNEVVMRICVLDEPTQIADISQKRFPILSNSSMILLADRRWINWYDVLQEFSTHTILFDLSPSTQFDRLSQQFDVIEHHKFHLKIDERIYPFVCLIARAAKSTSIYFMPASEVMVNILINYLDGKDTSKKYSESLEENKGINRIIRYGMNHLIDEAVFNFQTLNTEYASRGYASKSFSGTME